MSLNEDLNSNHHKEFLLSVRGKKLVLNKYKTMNNSKMCFFVPMKTCRKM